MSVRELLARMDSHELAEWIAFYAIEPFGEQRADLRAAIVASVIANCNRGKNQKAFKPADFMPFKEAPPPKKPQSMSEQQAPFKVLTQVLAQRKRRRK